MADELKLKINVEMVGGDKAVSNLDKINERIEKATNLSNDLAKAFSAFKEMTKGLDTLASATKTFSSAFKDVSGTTKTSIASFDKLSKTLNSLEQNQAKLKVQEEKLNQEKLKTITLANREVASYEKTVGAMARTEAQLSKLGVQEARAAAQMDKLSNSTKSVSVNMSVANNSLSVFIGNLSSNALSRITSQMWDFVKSCSRAGIELDALRNTFAAATGGWKQGGQEMEWLIGMSDRLGLNFGSVSDSYAKFMTSFTRSGGTIEQSRQIFEDISAAMVNLHLPAERMQGVFIALEQMANKGTVQAEELKRQLGNALPAAFEIGAESMGILPKQLMDMMKKGEVFSKDFLPNFAKAVKENLGQGIEVATNQFNASLGRMNTAIAMFKMEVGQTLNAALKPFVDMITPVISGLAQMAKFFNENATACAIFEGALIGLTAGTMVKAIAMMKEYMALQVALKTGMAASSLPLGELIRQFSSFTGITSALKGILPALLNAIKGFFVFLGSAAGITFGAVTALASLAFYLRKCGQEAADVTPYMNMRDQITQLTKSVTELDLSTQEGQADLEKYKQEFPELTKYLIDNKVSLASLTDEQINQISALGELDKRQQILLEREKELNSWQAKLSATFQVAWDNIKNFVVAACKVCFGWIGLLIDKTKEAISNFRKLVKSNDIKALNKSLEYQKDQLAKAKGEEKKIWEERIAQTEKYLKEMQGLGVEAEKTGIGKNKQGQGGFWGDVNDKMIQNATKNATAKFEEMYKSVNKTSTALKNARAQYIGFQEATSDKKSKKGKTGAKGYQKTEAEKEFDKLKHEKSALEAKSAIGGLTDAERARYKELTSLINGNKVALKELISSESDIFDLKQKKISQLENEIKLGLYQGQNVEKLVSEYNLEKLKMDEVNDAFNRLTGDLQDGWKREEAQLKRLRAEYKYMVTHVNEFTDAEIKQAQATLKSQEALAAYAKTMAELEKPAEITKRHAKDLGKNLVDGLLDVVDGSKTFWEAFAEIGKTTLKNYASDMMKNFLDKAVASFAYGNATGGIKGGLGIMFSSIFGMGINGGQKTQGGLGQDSSQGVLGGDNGLFSPLIQEANLLSSTLETNVLPSLTFISDELTNGLTFGANTAAESLTFMSEGALNSTRNIMGLSNPIMMAAQSMISMATTAPMAGAAMTTFGSVMTTVNPMLAPAAKTLTQMAASMAQVGASAIAAATGMAAMAVSQAALTTAKIPYVGGFLAPVAALLTGAGVAAGIAMTGAGMAASSAMAGIGAGIGSATSGIGSGIGGFASKLGGGKIIPHAKGGVVSSPTTFPMSGGNIGLAGEAGTEIIAPARRMSNGELGVGAVQPKVTVNNYANAAVEVVKRPDNEMEIKITELNAMLSSSRTNKGMASAQSRMSSRGKRIG